MRWPTNDERWHSWFAWHPVVIDGDWVWLETVERRLIHQNVPGSFGFWTPFYRYPQEQ